MPFVSGCCNSEIKTKQIDGEKKYCCDKCGKPCYIKEKEKECPLSVPVAKQTLS